MKEAFDRGLAVGIPEIRSDSIFFRYKDEEWRFPTFHVLPNHAHYNGVYYEAKPARLRKLARAVKENGHG